MNKPSKPAATPAEDTSAPELQDDDTPREEQQSHRDNQNRTKKDGHTTQVGSGQDQTSQRNRGTRGG